MTANSAATMRVERRGFSVAHATIVSVALWASALAIVLSRAHAPWRAGFVLGIACAAFSGLSGLMATGLTEGRKLNAVLLGRVSAFLGRLLLIGAGLGVTILVAHAEPLAFVLMFFPFFFVSTVLEQLIWATGRSGDAPTEIV